MFKSRKIKNFFNSNNMITKGMLKRRRLALMAIAQVNDSKQTLKVIK
jgi:hypothetical protein